MIEKETGEVVAMKEASMRRTKVGYDRIPVRQDTTGYDRIRQGYNRIRPSLDSVTDSVTETKRDKVSCFEGHRQGNCGGRRRQPLVHSAALYPLLRIAKVSRPCPWKELKGCHPCCIATRMNGNSNTQHVNRRITHTILLCFD